MELTIVLQFLNQLLVNNLRLKQNLSSILYCLLNKLFYNCEFNKFDKFPSNNFVSGKPPFSLFPLIQVLNVVM